MKYLTLVLCVFVTNVSQAAYLEYCVNYGDGVSYGFESCINNNFRTIERELRDTNIFVSHCWNSGDRVNYSFISCIQNNFRAVERAVDSYISWCTNFGDRDLAYSFVSCVNNNFRSIGRELPYK